MKSLVDYFNTKFNTIISNQENKNENNLALNCFQKMEKNNEINKINFEIFIKAMIKGINSIKEKTNKLIKIKDDNIIRLKQDIKKLVEDNIKLMKELETKYI